MVERVSGLAIAQAMELMIEYDPKPTYESGDPATAPENVLQLVRATNGDIVTDTEAAAREPAMRFQ